MTDAFCPITREGCRDDCEWAHNITEFDATGFTDDTFCCVAVIAAWCILDIQGNADDVFFDDEEDE